MNKHKILVYGTLRPGNTPTRLIPGVMYDIGAFPGIFLLDEKDGKFVTVEEIEVDNAGLARLDLYEGYRQDSPEGSLYIRTQLPCGGWIYQYNQSTHRCPVVEEGDWLKYRNQNRGTAANLTDNIISMEA